MTNWVLPALLDTSTSITDAFEDVLGVLRAFCEAAGVEQLRLVQADDRVIEDRWITQDDLRELYVRSSGDRELVVQPTPCRNCTTRHAFRPRGAPQTDLSAALEHLGRDPLVEAAIVFTDGYISIPARAPSYAVLWVLTTPNECFRPPYGRVVSMTRDRV